MTDAECDSILEAVQIAFPSFYLRGERLWPAMHVDRILKGCDCAGILCRAIRNGWRDKSLFNILEGDDCTFSYQMIPEWPRENASSRVVLTESGLYVVLFSLKGDNIPNLIKVLKGIMDDAHNAMRTLGLETADDAVKMMERDKDMFSNRLRRLVCDP